MFTVTIYKRSKYLSVKLKGYKIFWFCFKNQFEISLEFEEILGLKTVNLKKGSI